MAASGIWLTLRNGQKILDATSGAAVSSIGHGDARVKEAVVSQLDEIAYCHPGFYQTICAQDLATFLVDSTHGKMARALLTGSGSEAVETAMKLARQYFLEVSPPQSTRCRFISRQGSWHGCTIAALSVGDFKARKTMYDPIFPINVGRVSACSPYRDLRKGETTEEYVARLAQELDNKFRELGPETVCAFIIEPVSGSALGCTPAVPGYLEAMKAVCDRYGALLIFDEVMCGMGRTGTLHAWEHDGVVPDIEVVGKSLGSGYIPISAVLATERVISVFNSGTKYFAHGQTYQSHPAACAAALEVQRIIQEDNLLERVRTMGSYLEHLLKGQLGDHPHVGDIRGRGLFWAIEFVADKATKTPFEPALKVATKMHEKGMTRGYDISLFHANGSADSGWAGDHILLAPPYIVQEEDVEEIVERVSRVVRDVFEELALQRAKVIKADSLD